MKRIERPSHAGNGAQVAETWNYDDGARSVTHVPVLGAVPREIKTQISEDGSTTTVSVNGHGLVRTRRLGGLTEATEVYDDTRAVAAGWVEMVKKEINPAEGSASVTPWGLAENGVKLVSTVPGQNASVTINEQTGGGGRELRKLNLTGGLPSSMSNQADGVAKSLTLNHTAGRLMNATGTAGGEPIGFGLGADRRLGSLTLPSGEKNLTYGVDGTQTDYVAIVDGEQGTENWIYNDKFGDPSSRTGSGDVNWTFQVTDDAVKPKITINGQLERIVNVYGEDLEKKYDGAAFKEQFVRAPDGTVEAYTVISQGGSKTTSIEETETERTITHSDGLEVRVDLSRLGLPKAITQTGGQNERRKLEYERLALTKETHELGPLSGWTVEFVPDTRGRTGSVRATGYGLTREFTLGYDAASRLKTSVGTYGASQTAAIAERDQFGKVFSLTRRGLTTTWSRTVSYRLDGVTNVKDNTSFNYTYPGYDDRFRIRNRVASRGTSWTSMEYDDKDQLLAATLSPGPNREYNYDARQNRTSLTNVSQATLNGLDQATSHSLLSPTARGFGLQGFVKPGSTLEVLNPHIVGGQAGLSVDATTGAFAGFWSVGGTGSLLIDALVRARYTQPTKPEAIAEKRVFLRVPPMLTQVGFDDAGRQDEDAFWSYDWDGADRLIRMQSKLPAHPTGGTEEQKFSSDAQGRRIVKEYILTKDETRIVTRRTMLWAGWLPLCEILEYPAKPLTRRWFQWGPDISGSLDGAAGIGGLVAIHEEDAKGVWKRTLLPVNDGIGNITAVLDAADGRVVAQYEYGPFGEPLGETGEADACPFRWQSKYYDQETQLYYFPKRYYDPRTGRWLSRDPLGESGGFNLYAYCGNDPVNRHDPLGLDWGDRRPPERATLFDVLSRQWLRPCTARHTAARGRRSGGQWPFEFRL